jgi:beta-xylosidase
MYYTAQRAGLHCIGAAFSERVEGPYTAQTQPLICPLRQGGVLDPEGFRDADGRRYLIYKVDGNSFDKPHQQFRSTPLMLQQVAADGATLIDAPVQLLDRVWADGPLIEAPSMGRYETTKDRPPLYILFFSTHLFNGPGYNIKYAVAKSINGPFARAPRPLLKTGAGPNGQLIGPGGIDVGVSSDQVVFHSIKTGTMKTGSHLIRTMWTGRLLINDVHLSN